MKIQDTTTARPWTTTSHYIYGANAEAIGETHKAANATLIIQAVNEFDALNAVAQAAARIDDFFHWGRNDCHLAQAVIELNRAVTALAKVKGSASCASN